MVKRGTFGRVVWDCLGGVVRFGARRVCKLSGGVMGGCVMGELCIGVFGVYVGYIQKSFVPSVCPVWLSGFGYVVPYVVRYVLRY